MYRGELRSCYSRMGRRAQSVTIPRKSLPSGIAALPRENGDQLRTEPELRPFPRPVPTREGTGSQTSPRFVPQGKIRKGGTTVAHKM
jgi:hypothetical protein